MVKTTCEQPQDLEEVLKDYLDDEEVKKMCDYKAHGGISVYAHCLNVADLSDRIDKALGSKCDRKTLLLGALLHDFYLYDWHDARVFVNVFKMHGYTHPETACQNAIRCFDVDEGVQEVIRCHMWPLTLFHFPSSREAMIVCMADKICALKETFTR